MSNNVKFPSPPGSLFHATLKLRVDQFFHQNQISRNADGRMWRKAIFFLTGFSGMYLLIILNSLPLLAMLPIAAALGMFSAFVGFNVCHDAIHGSLSGNKNVNKAFGFIFNLVGASPYVWSRTHNIVHHTYTNIPGHDEDIEIAPGLIRITEDDEINAIQKYQHWYAFPLYGFASLSWVFRKDYVKFFQKKIGAQTNRHTGIEYFNLFFYKALYYFLFIVLPFIVLDLSWWQFLIGFLTLHIMEGLTMGLVFQLAHVVESTTFPMPNESGRMEDAWAEHQMRTTANFATQNKIASFFLGGLNRQIEHHLFPKICHIHYGEISKIVKQTAQEFGLPYIENKSFFSALHSHFMTLKRFAKDAQRKQKPETLFDKSLL